MDEIELEFEPEVTAVLNENNIVVFGRPIILIDNEGEKIGKYIESLSEFNKILLNKDEFKQYTSNVLDTIYVQIIGGQFVSDEDSELISNYLEVSIVGVIYYTSLYNLLDYGNLKEFWSIQLGDETSLLKLLERECVTREVLPKNKIDDNINTLLYLLQLK